MSKENLASAQEATGQIPTPDFKAFVRLIEPKDNLLGFANVTINDSFVIEDFKVMKSEKGLFVGMPSKAQAKDGTTTYRDTAKPITKEAHAALTKAVTIAFTHEVDKLKAKTAILSSLTIDEKMAKGKEQAAKANAARPAPSRDAKAKKTERE